MAQYIDPARLPADQARAMRDAELQRCEAARLAAGLSRGANRQRFARYARQHGRNALALSDAIDGPIPADIAAMSDDQLVAELLA